MIKKGDRDSEFQAYAAQAMVKLRKACGLLQEDVSQKLHLTQAAYSHLESGNTNISVAYIEALCELYEVSPGYFFPGEGVELDEQSIRLRRAIKDGGLSESQVMSLVVFIRAMGPDLPVKFPRAV